MNKKNLPFFDPSSIAPAVVAAAFIFFAAANGSVYAQSSVSVKVSSSQTSNGSATTQSVSNSVNASGLATTDITTTAQTSTPSTQNQSSSVSVTETATQPSTTVATPAATTNLVPNPTLANVATGLPTGWSQGFWGTNTRIFTYPVTGHTDNYAAKVQISAYTSGDVKWYFNPVAITPGTYQFSDYYQSNISSQLVAQYTNGSGNLTYADLATLGAPASTTTWQNATVNFTVPAGTARITIYHLISGVGWLTVDDYSLTSYTTPVVPQPPAPTAADLILNPSLEYLDAGKQPIGWSQGGWGTNNAAYSVYNPGESGSYAAQVQITTYTNGDAKWYFAPVAVTPNYKYTYTDYYQSNIASSVMVQIQLGDGTAQYSSLGNLAAAQAWTKFTGSFSTPPNAKTVTVYHLISGVGWLRTDNFGLVQVVPSQLGTGMVSLNFDDGWLSAYQNAYPILKAAGFKATFNIFTDAFNDSYDYMTLAQAKSLYATGNEIGSHSVTHSDLTTLPATQLTNEISGSKSWFAQNGILTTTFAYPYGAYNQSVETAVKNAGYVAARSSDNGYNDKASDKYALRIFSVENTTTIAQIKTVIDYAKANKVWLILLVHEVLANTAGKQYSTTPTIIQQTADYLTSQKITVLTNNQASLLLGQ